MDNCNLLVTGGFVGDTEQADARERHLAKYQLAEGMKAVKPAV
jgi:hypothetical protein